VAPVIRRQPRDPKDDPNKTPHTVDPSGKLTPGTTAAAKNEGVWRIPVHGLLQDSKAWAIVLIPNIGVPTVSGVDVEVLLHFHGYGAGYRMLQPGEQDLGQVLQPGQLRDIDLYQMEQQLLLLVKTKKKFVVAVLPQGGDKSEFGNLPRESGPYLKEVFDRLIAENHLPAGTRPGNVTISGHSGGSVAATAAASVAAGRQDLLVFDAINFKCTEKVQKEKNAEKQFDKHGSPEMICKRCDSNEYQLVKNWVTDRIRKEAKLLVTAKKLKDEGTRFRGFTHAPLDAKETCSYGHWYARLKADIDRAITDLDATADVELQLHDNFQVSSVPVEHERGEQERGEHERVMAASLKAALS